MDKNTEMMKKLIEAKRNKSSSQTSDKRGPDSLGSKRTGSKKFKKGGLFDK